MDPNGEGYTPNFEGQDFQEEVHPAGQEAQNLVENGAEGQDYPEQTTEVTEGQYFVEDVEEMNK